MRVVGRSLRDLAAYARNPEARRALREAAPATASAVQSAERLNAPASALPFDGLSSASLALAALRVSPGSRPALNLAIGEIRQDSVYAGIDTALRAAAGLSRRLGLRLRVVMLDPTSPGNSAAVLRPWLRSRLAMDDIDVVTRESIPEVEFGASDFWLATHSKTAHALQVGCLTGGIAPTAVAYLIQDYEPGFSPWSTQFATAAATYHAGFLPIVNSRPVWSYLQKSEHLVLDPELVFAPALETELLSKAAAAREASDSVRVLFYARRNKPRNMFELGLAAIRSAAADLGRDYKVQFVSAGAQHPPVDIGEGRVLTGQGRLAWDQYFGYLAKVHVALSLQLSPHPSHPPLEAAVSGALAVTNEFDGSRAGLHQRIMAANADPVSLGTALAEAVRVSAESGPGAYQPIAEGVLGRSLDDVLDTAAEQLSRR